MSTKYTKISQLHINIYLIYKNFNNCQVKQIMVLFKGANILFIKKEEGR